MAEEEQLLNLYNSLRSEILHADTQNYQVLAFTVAASAALIAAGVGQSGSVQRGVIFALVYLVSWPCQRLLQGNRRRVWRVATYLRMVVEPQLKAVSWESDLASLSRRIGPAKWHRVSTRVSRNEWMIIAVLNLSAAICIIGLSIAPAAIHLREKLVLGTGVVLLNTALLGYSRYLEGHLTRGSQLDSLLGEAWRPPQQNSISPASQETSSAARPEDRPAAQ